MRFSRSPWSIVAALAAVLVFAVVWRFPARDAEWSFVFCEGDSLLQLHRVKQCLDDFPRVPSVDADSHYPDGYRVPWNPLHTLAYAVFAKVTGASSDLDVLAGRLSWIPPVLGAVAVLLAAAITWQATASGACTVAVALLCAISGEVVRPFLYGIIDHHLFAHLGVLLLVLARLRRSLWLWIAGTIALIAMTPEAPIFVSLVLACLFASDALALLRDTATRPMSWAWYLSPAAVAAGAWLVSRFVDSQPLPLSAIDWMHLSLFHPLWFGVSGGGLRFVLAAVMQWRHRKGGVRAVAGVLLVVAVVTAAGLAFLWEAGALALVARRLLSPDRIYVGEEAAVFQAGFWRAPAWYRLLAFSSAFLALELLQAVRRRKEAETLFFWLVLFAALLVGFREFRHLYVVSSLQLVGLGVAAFGMESALRRLPSFSSPRTRWLPAAALAVAILPPLALSQVPGRTALGAVCDGLPVLRSLTAWVAQNTPEPHVSGEARATYGVFGPWSIGHHLHVLGGRPVIVDPLNYDKEGRFDEALEATWRATTADELMTALAKYGVRYVVLTNPAEEIVGLMRRYDARPAEFATVSPEGRTVFLPRLYEFAAFRLFMTSGSTGEFDGLEPRFFTEEAETYTTGSASAGDLRQVIVPDGQIYEVKPDAAITAGGSSQVASAP